MEIIENPRTFIIKITDQERIDLAGELGILGQGRYETLDKLKELLRSKSI